MYRRSFIKNTALCAVAVSASGFIRFDGNKYVGDCETTTDILGPFYRPDSPIRKNLLIKGDKGILTELSGIIMHKDCSTPYKNAKIEIWHCDAKGVYDNSSDEFRYRATSFSDNKGYYSFKTILPVPYDIGGGQARPAHFHLMITAEGYQPLVTQLYFTGDPFLTKDPSSASPTAKKRILDLQTLADGTKKLVYNVGMSDVLALEPTAIDRLAGLYTNEKNATQQLEFLAKNKGLWLKNEVFGYNLVYLGNNTFEIPFSEPLNRLHFELLSNGSVKLTGEEAGKTADVFIKGK